MGRKHAHAQIQFISSSTGARTGFAHVEQPVVSAPRRAAFTLVELLVVIGIIAILIGILLPVLSRVNQQARDLQCTANIRTCLQLFMTYAAENKGSLPYGWYFNRSN